MGTCSGYFGALRYWVRGMRQSSLGLVDGAGEESLKDGLSNGGCLGGRSFVKSLG